MALAADLTRDEQRTKAMAMIGSTIGLTFAVSLVASPWLNHLIGVPGIFAMTGVLALAAIGVVYRVIPDVTEPPRPRAPNQFRRVLHDTQLLRLNFGIMALQAVLMALFIAVPFSLRSAGLAVAHHWHVYLPVMLGSFVLMVPAVIGARKAGQMKAVFIGSIAVLLAGYLAMPWLTGSIWLIASFLLVFFTSFNVLEACLPSLISRMAPPDAKGTAIGVYSSVQFFGSFLGAAGGGFLYQHWGDVGVVIFASVLLAIWLILALGMKVPALLSKRVYTIPELDIGRADRLTAELQALPGVHKARVAASEHAAYLEVDSAAFDEQNVLKLIAGGT